MAKKQGVNKTKAVEGYMKAHPKAKPIEIAEALSKEGIKLKASHVSNIRSHLKRMRLAKKIGRGKAAAPAPQAPTAASQPAAAATEKPVASGATVALAHVRAVTETVKEMGGFGKLNELLDVIKEVGGVRRFRELLEAMGAAGSDDIRF